MARYAEAHGVTAQTGAETTLEIDGSRYVGTTIIDGSPVIRTTATVEPGNLVRANGQSRYITRVDNEFHSGRYAFVADIAETTASVSACTPTRPAPSIWPRPSTRRSNPGSATSRRSRH